MLPSPLDFSMMIRLRQSLRAIKSMAIYKHNVPAAIIITAAFLWPLLTANTSDRILTPNVLAPI